MGAAPSPSPSVPVPAPASNVKLGAAACTITDTNATEITGMAFRGGVLYAVGAGLHDSSHRKVFRFKPDCTQSAAPISFPESKDTKPFDPEDIALAPDGTLYIGDIGDSKKERPSVSVWKLDSSDKIDGPFRYSYPEGKFNAEALLIGSDGLPIIITKGDGGGTDKPKVYVATAAATQKASSTFVPLKAAGELTLPKTNSEVALAPARGQVSSASISADRKKVVIRTLGDAYEFDVANDDIVGSIVNGKPRVTPLTVAAEFRDQTASSITYSNDGKNFLTVGQTWFKTDSKEKRPTLWKFDPAADAVVPPPANTGGAAEPAKSKSLFQWMTATPSRIYLLIGSVGVLGLILVGVGVFGILKARKKAEDGDDDDEDVEDGDLDPETMMLQQFPPPGYPPYGGPGIPGQGGPGQGGPGYGGYPAPVPGPNYGPPQGQQYPPQGQYPPGQYGSPQGGYPDNDPGYGQQPGQWR